jgi:hypothetical protein
VMKPFFLYIHEWKGQLLGFWLSYWHFPVSYLSKQLNAVSQGWPHCLHTLATTASLLAQADKLTLEQEFTV